MSKKITATFEREDVEEFLQGEVPWGIRTSLQKAIEDADFDPDGLC